jgi:hypothetical protein
MSLKDDVNAALVELGHKVKFPVAQLDGEGLSRLTVPIPPMLHTLRDGELVIDIRISRKGDTFALFTPIAALTQPAKQVFLEALLRRQFINGQASGLSFAINTVDDDYDALVVITHWLLPSITPEAFNLLYQRFIAATLYVIDDVNDMIKTTPHVTAIHPR